MKLSIIIPVYNIGAYIEMTLKSVLSQMCEETELIIINDGSTDNSLDVINNYLNSKSQNFSIRVESKVNEGVSVARNTGINLAQGKYVYFLDGDDILKDGTITKVLKNIEMRDADLIIGGFDRLDLNENIAFEFNQMYSYPLGVDDVDILLRKYFLKDFVISIGSIICKRAICIEKEIYFKEGHKYGEDVRFYIEYISSINSIQIMECSLFQYRSRPDSAIGNFIDNSIGITRAYIEQFESIERKLLTNNRISDRTVGLIHSCVIPGLVLATTIAIYKKKPSLIGDIPNDFRDRLLRVTFKHCIIWKKKRGIGLYFGSLIYGLFPQIFGLIIKFIKTKKRFQC